MAIQCEICGSTNLLKENGVFVCQSCGLRYSVEEIRQMVGNAATASAPAPTPKSQPTPASNAAALIELEEKIRQTEATWDALFKKRCSLVEEANKHVNETKRLMAQCEQLIAKKKLLEPQMQALSQRTDEVYRKLTAFDAREKELQRQAAELRARGDVIVARHGALMQERERLGPYDSRRRAEIDREVSDILREVDSLNARLNAMGSEQLQTQPRWQATIQEAQRIQAEYDALKAESDRIISESELCTKQLNDHQRENNRLAAEIQKASAEGDRLEAELNRLRAERDALKKKNGN